MRTFPRGQQVKNAPPERAAKPIRPLTAAAALAAAVLIAGCSSSVQTPLPSLSPSSSTSMSESEQKEAVKELNRLRTSSEQDAIRSIEESR